MRIIGGTGAGRTFDSPRNLPVRPTTDFAKSGLFNVLHHRMELEGLTVLDLFSGTGNMGLEFSSRGCSSVTCVDNHAACIKFIRDCASRLEMIGVVTILSDVFRFLEKCHQKFDLIFADPPYDLPFQERLPELILGKKLLDRRGIFILEHRHKKVPVSSFSPFETRKYGDCAFSFYRLPEKGSEKPDILF